MDDPIPFLYHIVSCKYIFGIIVPDGFFTSFYQVKGVIFSIFKKFTPLNSNFFLQPQCIDADIGLFSLLLIAPNLA